MICAGSRTKRFAKRWVLLNAPGRPVTFWETATGRAVNSAEELVGADAAGREVRDLVYNAKGSHLAYSVGPDRIVQRFDYQNSKSVYWSTEDFVADVVRIEREMIRSLIDAGCRYVQIDAPSYTAYVDAPSLDEMKERGEDPMKNLMRSIKADNEILRLFDGVTFGIHLCRGNQRSMWHREGSYDAIAERLFNELRHDRLLLEYDSPRAGTFEPLRFVPKGKIVVLGLVSTKIPEIEKVDDLKGRAKEAAGDLTDNDDLKREGKVDRGAAKVKEKVKDAVDKVRDKVEDLND